MLDNFREWLSDNLRYILLGLAVLLVVIVSVCVVRLIRGGSSKPKSPGQSPKVTSNVSAKAEEEEATEDGSFSMEAPATTSEDLVRDDPVILALVQKYYTALAAKDADILASIVSPWNDEVKASILSNSAIQSYNDIATYSKKGPVDGSYVVYAYYKGKIAGISSEAPSLSMLYVVTDESGDLVVSTDVSSQEVSDYLKKVSSDEDVQELIDDVNKLFAKAEDADPTLKAYMNGEAVVEETNAGGGSTATKATATSGVNIRAEGSTSAAILDTLYVGAEVTVIERGTDWTHINYTENGSTIDGYVASQYLNFGD